MAIVSLTLSSTRDCLVSHVRDVDAAEPAGNLRQLDDLVGRRERAWNVKKASAQAERTVRHSLLDDPAHLLHLVGVRRRD